MYMHFIISLTWTAGYDTFAFCSRHHVSLGHTTGGLIQRGNEVLQTLLRVLHFFVLSIAELGVWRLNESCFDHGFFLYFFIYLLAHWAHAFTSSLSVCCRSSDDLYSSCPSFSLCAPSLRYIAHLDAPGLSIIGAGEPAKPTVEFRLQDHRGVWHTLDEMPALTKEPEDGAPPAQSSISLGSGNNRQYRDESKMNELHPYCQTLTIGDLENCVHLENATFPEHERCSREKVSLTQYSVYQQLFRHRKPKFLL